ncbi:hypothetical protein ACLOJK_030905 [Asimina triloba]
MNLLHEQVNQGRLAKTRWFLAWNPVLRLCRSTKRLCIVFTSVFGFALHNFLRICFPISADITGVGVMGWFSWVCGIVTGLLCLVSSVSGIGANWGTQCSHPLSPDRVVRLLRENRIQKVKLFDAESNTLRALGGSGIEVMVGIPNDMLYRLATSVKAAEDWVAKNVSSPISSHNVNIKCDFSSYSTLSLLISRTTLNGLSGTLQPVPSAMVVSHGQTIYNLLLLFPHAVTCFSHFEFPSDVLIYDLFIGLSMLPNIFLWFHLASEHGSGGMVLDGHSSIEFIIGSIGSGFAWHIMYALEHLLTQTLCFERYVAVGNEPFLSTFNGSFLNTTLPALQNVQAALIKAALSSRVKVTIPLNADVYESSSSLPSGGDFRSDIRDLMITIIKFLSDNAAPFTVNIYPFISLYSDPSFPVDYAFFDGVSSPINDGGTLYNNVFDANYDTLVWALRKNGYQNLPIIIGEVGWPTDGDKNANLKYAQRFNQGFMNRISKGTPMQPGPLDAYLFSLIDEDEKSIAPGNFERHWGLFFFDGMPKYQLNLGATNSGSLVPARNVRYLSAKWCVLSPSANVDDPQVAPSVQYACENADCTCLGYGTSCEDLDTRGNISYAFNSYYQKFNQLDSACRFPNLSMITRSNPSTGNCIFRIMIEPEITSDSYRLHCSGRAAFSLVYHSPWNNLCLLDKEPAFSEIDSVVAPFSKALNWLKVLSKPAKGATSAGLGSWEFAFVLQKIINQNANGKMGVQIIYRQSIGN